MYIGIQLTGTGSAIVDYIGSGGWRAIVIEISAVDE